MIDTAAARFAELPAQPAFADVAPDGCQAYLLDSGDVRAAGLLRIAGVAGPPRRSGGWPRPSSITARRRRSPPCGEAPYLRRSHDVLLRSCRRPAGRSTWPEG